jgi:hypothetical protein
LGQEVARVVGDRRRSGDGGDRRLELQEPLNRTGQK